MFNGNSLFGNDSKGVKKELVKLRYEQKLKKTKLKYFSNALASYEAIERLIEISDESSDVMLFSEDFDAPNFVNYINLHYRILEINVATWAITNSGIACLHECLQDGKQPIINCVLDLTHSYKWVFTSGAHEVLKDKVNFYFAHNHSKFISIKTESGYFTFIGSMNLSNNPRWENIHFSRSVDAFDFCAKFIEHFKNDKQSKGHKEITVFGEV